jgi:hypothetical protein
MRAEDSRECPNQVKPECVQFTASLAKDGGRTMDGNEHVLLNRLTAIALATALAMGFSGCKQQAPTAAKSDQQIATDIKAKIGAESALNGQNIVVSVQDGRATLTGAANDDASRALAANDAGSVDGVKTVINNLIVQPPTQAAQAPPQAAQSPAPQAPPAIAQPSQPSESAAERRAARAQAREEKRRQHEAEVAAAAPPPPPPPPAQAANPEPMETVAPPPPPPPRPAVRTVTVAAGTILPIRMTDSLDSATTQSGTTFRGSLANDLVVDGMVAAPRGATVIGRVVDARDATHFAGSSLLAIELTTLDAHGQQVGLVTDQYSKQGAGRGKNTAEKAGVGAGIGAVIGALAGGGKGAAIGAAAGGGLGAGSNGIKRGQQVQIPTETLVNFTLRSDFSVNTSQKIGDPRNYDSNQGPELQKRDQ